MKNDRFAWPILLLLLTALVPSLGVVWMMREAVQNDRLAANQRLAEAYRAQLQSASQIVAARWQTDVESLKQSVDPLSPARSFVAIVSMGKCDSVVIGRQESLAERGDSSPSDSYPTIEEETETDISVSDSAAWKLARKLEFAMGQSRTAAKHYHAILNSSDSDQVWALARQAIARCLTKAGSAKEAVNILIEQAGITTIDAQGRSYAANAEMRLLQTIPKDSQLWKETAANLTRRLNDYSQPMVSTQRLFLMKSLAELLGEKSNFPTSNAEQIAIHYLESMPKPQRQSEQRQLVPATIDNFWQHTSSDGTLTALWSTESVIERLENICKEIPLPTGVEWVVIEPSAASNSLVDVSLSPVLNHWKLGVASAEDMPAPQSSRGRTAVYIWITLLVVAATTVLAWMLSTSVRRRLELAEQKNSLVANVSHELKTPLASIRLLVDTLQMNQESNGDAESSNQQAEYLQLIAQENSRLTRLINNFLTFSKMDQGNPSFNLQSIDLANVASTAIHVFCDRTPEAAGSIRLNNAEESMVHGDFDALVTALVNLLENAWKYNSSEKKEVSVNVSQRAAQATVSVSDNGMGIGARSIRKIFDRFYQANALMTRKQGGCGLGLSIVKAIIESHSGAVTVESKPDVGSTFTISIPLVEPARAPKAGAYINE